MQRLTVYVDWRKQWRWKPAPTGRGNKRRLKERLMDSCKMTVKALLMPCGIVSPERQCFNELLISVLYMLIWDLTHWGLNIKLMSGNTYGNQIWRCFYLRLLIFPMPCTRIWNDPVKVSSVELYFITRRLFSVCGGVKVVEVENKNPIKKIFL